MDLVGALFCHASRGTGSGFEQGDFNLSSIAGTMGTFLDFYAGVGYGT